MLPSLIRPLKRWRHGAKPYFMAMVSIAMKPMLCRFRAIPGSGLPRPTQSSMTGGDQRRAPPRAGAAAGAAAAGAAVGAAAAVGSAATSASFVGGATVATTKLRATAGRVFSVPFRSSQRTASLKSRSAIGGELLGDMLRLCVDLDGVTDDVQDATALQAWAQPVILEMHRHRYADRLAWREALKIDMLGCVGHRVELHVAEQRLCCIAVDLDPQSRDCQPGRLSSRSTARGSSAMRLGVCWPRR